MPLSESAFPTSEDDLLRREHCPACGGDHRPAERVGELRYSRCRSCGLTFMNPMPTQRWYDRRYESEYWRGQAKETDPQEEILRRLEKEHLRATAYLHALRTETRTLPTDGRVLEIGCGAGGAVATVAAGLGWSAAGVEPDAASRTIADRIGVRVLDAELSAVVARGERFDVVLLSHVLEHVVDPPTFLANVAEVLAPDGRLVIEVPNSATNDSLHLFHPYLFTRRALTTLLSDHGFEAQVIAHGGASSVMRFHYLLAVAQRSPRRNVRGFRRHGGLGRRWARAWKRGRVLRRVDRLLVAGRAEPDAELLASWQKKVVQRPEA